MIGSLINIWSIRQHQNRVKYSDDKPVYYTSWNYLSTYHMEFLYLLQINPANSHCLQFSHGRPKPRVLWHSPAYRNVKNPWNITNYYRLWYFINSMRLKIWYQIGAIGDNSVDICLIYMRLCYVIVDLNSRCHASRHSWIHDWRAKRLQILTVQDLYDSEKTMSIWWQWM